MEPLADEAENIPDLAVEEANDSDGGNKSNQQMNEVEQSLEERVETPSPIKRGSLISDRMKWLDDQNKKEQEGPRRHSVAVSYGGSLISDRMKWLDNQNKKEYDGPRQDKVDIVVQKGVAANRSKWLESGAKDEKKEIQKEADKRATVSVSYGGSLISDRMKWLDEQGKTKEFDGPRQDKVEGVQKGVAANRSKWLESGAKDDEKEKQKEIEKQQKAVMSYGGSLVSDRMKWLDGQGKAKEFDGPRQDQADIVVQKGVAAERSKWLESGAKDDQKEAEKKEEMQQKAAMSYGGSLISDRMKWLDEQGKAKEFDGPRQDQLVDAVVQKGVAAERSKWLESGAKDEKKEAEKEESRQKEVPMSYGCSLVSDRMKWLDEQKKIEYDGPRQDVIDGIEKGVAAERSKWLESGAKD